MKRIIAILLAMASTNAPAFELALTAAERDQCAAEGGCVVISRALIQQAVDRAYRAGQATCERRL